MSLLQDFKPKVFFKWFEPITQIPRPTDHEEQITDFIEKYAVDHGYDYYRDQKNNIIIYVPASNGYENEQSILLQGHTDMVAAVDPGIVFDFEKDPIKLRIVNGNEVMGTGTTLGADDGSGVATMLAIADDPTVKHPALELLFTTAEETGFNGVKEFDFSKISSRRMINLDSGRVHNIGISSVGVVTIQIHHVFDKVETADTSETGIVLHLYDGKNGHSGLDAFRNRANAANIAGYMLSELKRYTTIRIAQIDTVQDGIISDFKVEFYVQADRKQASIKQLESTFERIKVQFQDSDPDFKCDLTEVSENRKVLTIEDSYKTIDLMSILQTGIRKTDPANPSYVISSTSLISIGFHNANLYLEYHCRSGEDSYRDMLAESTLEMIRLIGFEGEIVNQYDGWMMKKNSKMVETFELAHEELFGYQIGHWNIHGGLEIGVITGAIPGMDAVAMIPSLSGAHTTKELLYIDQVMDFWKLITAVLAKKSE